MLTTNYYRRRGLLASPNLRLRCEPIGDAVQRVSYRFKNKIVSPILIKGDAYNRASKIFHTTSPLNSFSDAEQQPASPMTANVGDACLKPCLL